MISLIVNNIVDEVLDRMCLLNEIIRNESDDESVEDGLVVDVVDGRDDDEEVDAGGGTQEEHQQKHT